MNKNSFNDLAEKFSYKERHNVVNNLKENEPINLISFKRIKSQPHKVTKRLKVNKSNLKLIPISLENNYVNSEAGYLPLPDLLSSNLQILFIGYNPSLRSSLIQHRFAHPTNKFWSLLHQSGLTKRLLRPEDDESLRITSGFGFTELVKRPTRNIAELTKEEMIEGVEELIEKVNMWKPKVVCCVGKGVFENILKGQGINKRSHINWGEQESIDFTSEKVRWFVVPSTSGLVRIKTEEVLEIWKKLNHLVSSDKIDDRTTINLSQNI